jgi:hypothetical protein
MAPLLALYFRICHFLDYWKLAGLSVLIANKRAEPTASAGPGREIR